MSEPLGRLAHLYGKQMFTVQAGRSSKTAVLLGSKRPNTEGFSVHLPTMGQAIVMVCGVKGINGEISPILVMQPAASILRNASRHKRQFKRELDLRRFYYGAGESPKNSLMTLTFSGDARSIKFEQKNT